MTSCAQARSTRALARISKRRSFTHACARRGPRSIGGAFLLEALVALVVFSIGTVGLLGVIAGAVRDSGNARWRGEAFDIAASALARMWTEDPAALASRYDGASNGPGYRALAAAAARLPGVSADVNSPVVAIDDAGAGRRRIAVTVYWQLPGDPHPHRSFVTGVLPGA